MAIFPWVYNDNKLYGAVATGKGIKIAGMGVVLWKVSEDGTLLAQIDYDTTDKDGAWQFGITESGFYTVKFYGGGAIPENFINIIDLEYSAAGTDYNPLEYSIQPIISINELTSKVDINRAEKAVIQIAFSNLTVVS